MVLFSLSRLRDFGRNTYGCFVLLAFKLLVRFVYLHVRPIKLICLASVVIFLVVWDKISLYILYMSCLIV